MRGRPVLRTIRLGSADPSLLRGLLLALLFLAGALAGHLRRGGTGGAGPVSDGLLRGV